MEETNEELKVGTLTWGRISKAAILLGGVYLHFQGYELAISMLGLLVFVFSGLHLFNQYNFVQYMPGLAIQAAMGDKFVQVGLLMNNPYSTGAFTLLAVNSIVSYTLFFAGMWIMAIMAIVPSLLAFIIYGRLSTLLASDFVQNTAKYNLRMQDYLQKRSEIFQDELNRYMAQIEEDTNARMKSMYPELHEEMYHEPSESSESDQAGESTTGSDD